MSRTILLLLSAVSPILIASQCGCRQSEADPGIGVAAVSPDDAEVPSRTSQGQKAEPETTPSIDDYSTWQRTTEEPFVVGIRGFASCRPMSAPPRDYGPHVSPALQIYLNAQAAERLKSGLFREDTTSMPIGAAIVKEKWTFDGIDRQDIDRRDNNRPGKLEAYAAMIKREAGYDPEHGDWEYVYTTLGDEGKTERGKLSTCIDCHSKAVSSDYLFGDHLQIHDDGPVDRANRRDAG